MDRIIPTMDNEVSSSFKKILEKQGFKFLLKTKVVGGKGAAEGCKVEIEPAEGGAR